MTAILSTRSRRLLTCGALCLLAAAPVAAQKVYQWTDASGRTVFSDTPPPNQHTPVKEKDVTQAPRDETLDYSLRRTVEAFPVVLYTTENCTEHCDTARALLNTRKIPFSERTVATEEDGEAFKTAFGNDALIPSATVGRQKLRGYNENLWNALLDDVGYPKP